MRKRWKWLCLGSAGLAVLSAASLAAVPTLRHLTSAVLNDPARLPTLDHDNRVHYQPPARACALKVAALLPAAMEKVADLQGPWERAPLHVAVFHDEQTYARANGTGATWAIGTTFRGRIALSPRLCAAEEARLRAILTHELSHAQLEQHVGGFGMVDLPNWFKEGLAVYVSGGGGAEHTSEDQARAAMNTGTRIALKAHGSLLNLAAVKFELPPEWPDTAAKASLAYRQAGMFVAYLHTTNPKKFERMMAEIRRGKSFAESFQIAWESPILTLWAHAFFTPVQPE